MDIIIDYGAAYTKYGYANQQPLTIHSYVNKFKDVTNMTSMIALPDTDIFKNYRSPFERNLLQHSGALESLTDNIFSTLGIRDRIQSSCILTECFASTDLARNMLLELFFECYQVPSVMLGVDALFAAFNGDLSEYHNQTKLLVSLGDQTTHIVPIVNGEVIYSNIKRLNIGGLHSWKYFYQTIQTRHPHLKLSYQTLDTYYRQYTQVAVDYQAQLRHFRHQENIHLGYRDRITEENLFIPDPVELIDEISIFFPTPVKVVLPEDLKRKEEIRQKMRIRLQESIQQGRDKKKAQLQEQLESAQNMYNTTPTDLLKKQIVQLQVKMGLLPKEALDDLKYSLLNTPDSELTPSQINIKRYQKALYDQNNAKKQKNQEFKKKQQEADRFKLEEPEKYLDVMYEKRDRIFQTLNDRKKLQQEMSTRNSRFNQKRIQTLAFLGQDMDENFGKNDNDWELYRSITKEVDSEDEKLKYKLQEIESELKELDPEFEQKILQTINNIHYLNMNLNSLTLTVDRVRCHEIYFQPSIIGVEQQSIIDAIKLATRGLPLQLMQNIHLIGGGALIQNLDKRLKRDLTSEYDCPIEITISDDPIMGAWWGMQKFSKKYQTLVKQFSLSRDEYLENGGFRQNPFSNIVD